MNKPKSATHFTVYSKPRCVQCDATKREIKKKGGTFTDIDLTQDEVALAEFKSQNIAQAPIVVGPDGTQWAGFRPDLIRWYFIEEEAA